MATVEIRVPDIGDFKDVPIIEVYVSAGSEVKAEDPLITLESDKASMEVPAPRAGRIERLVTRSAKAASLLPSQTA
jgi:pyruvate/2-oxoglutarate dehydrogenase complex dihydrolipoamide acyltransferase (E2) component